MTTIDHRILIPAGPEAVWEYVSDITHNPDWQIDCAEVIFLTSRREGPGVRWRYSAPGGHEYVIAVTAWYNGLGYEYYYVDGVPYKENKGRIRLQEIPEGTIVQWTFTYELGGLLGGMRNSLGVSRSVDVTISESLKTLYQKIKQSGAAARPHESKSLMRDAPNVDARSAYQPRHPSIMEEDSRTLAPPTRGPEPRIIAPRAPTEPRIAPVSRVPVEPPIGEDDGQRIRVIAEPPFAEDDTRRKAAAAAQTPPLLEDSIPLDDGEPDFLRQLVDFSRFEPPRAPAVVEEEPDFLKQLIEPPVSPSDTQPRKPITPAEEAAPPVVSAAPVSAFEPPPSADDTAPVAIPASPFAPPAEETTEPTMQVPDETQADYAPPVRSYDWPMRETLKPEPPKTEPVTSAFAPPEAPAAEIKPPPLVEPLRSPPTPISTPPVVIEAEPEPAKPAPGAQIEPAPQIIVEPEPVRPAPTGQIEPAPAAKVEPPPAIQPKVAAETASIWEIFGVQRPSEADASATTAPAAPIAVTPQPEAPAEMPISASAPVAQAETSPAVVPQAEAAAAPIAVTPPPEAPAEVPISASAPVAQAETPLPDRIVLPPAPGRAGLRLALRRKQIVVRRP